MSKNTNLTNELKRVNPFISNMVDTIRTIPNYELNDLTLLQDTVRLAMDKAIADAVTEDGIATRYKNIISSDNKDYDSWQQFVIALHETIVSVENDVDYTYIKTKMYPVFNAGKENPTDQYPLNDLILELQLIDRCKRKERQATVTESGNWFTNWWKNLRSPKIEVTAKQ